MPVLILVKHSLPEINPQASAHEWRLSEEGRERSRWLAERLEPYAPVRIFASQEPKAAETGSILAECLGKPTQIWPGLHEHLRRQEAFSDTAEFQANVQRFFTQADERVFGEESARQALERFSGAIQGLLQGDPQETLLVVAHGTVISLFVAAVNGVEPFPLWQRLGLPSFVVLSRPSLELLEIVAEIQPPDTGSHEILD